MKKIAFELTKPTKLIPLSGITRVDIESTGRFEVVLGSVDNPRRRDVIIHQTEHARLYQTPSGSIRKVVVTLPSEQTLCSKVVSEVMDLFYQYEEEEDLQ